MAICNNDCVIMLKLISLQLFSETWIITELKLYQMGHLKVYGDFLHCTYSSAGLFFFCESLRCIYNAYYHVVFYYGNCTCRLMAVSKNLNVSLQFCWHEFCLFIKKLTLQRIFQSERYDHYLPIFFSDIAEKFEVSIS